MGMGHLTFAKRLRKRERAWLESIVTRGEHPARDIRRAHIILLSDAGRSRRDICTLLPVSSGTVDRTRRRWIAEGVKAAVADRPRPGRPPILTPRDEAEIVALVCTPPPTGARRWAHRRLTEELNRQGRIRRSVSRETVRRALARHDLKPWKKGLTGASPS